MSDSEKNSNLELKPLSQSNIVVTGGSRDIGGGIVLELANAGAKVLSVFRSKPDRAQRLSDEVIKSGKKPILCQVDLTSQEGREELFSIWKKEFDNQIDTLVLCASGATLEINVDANMALVDKFLELRQQNSKNNSQKTAGTIIFLQSEPGHYHRVIDGVFDFIDYYRTKVGPAKRAGEDAFRQHLKIMKEIGVRGVVVCPPEVTDTFNMKLFELQNKEARSKSRELSAMLGTKAYVTISEVARSVKEIISDERFSNGDIRLFGKVQDGVTILNSIYGEEAIYIHTYEKSSNETGIGRIIVNPSLWKREEEPAFSGELKAKKENQYTTTLKITKDHTRGHFRPDISLLFPGHKSIRTAAVALSRFLAEDGSVDDKKIVLKKYSSVKFKNPVLPGQTLVTQVSLKSKSAKSAEGDASQTVDGKESMDIRGMVVESVDSASSALILDQLVESAAQAIGMHVLDSLKGQDVLPLFHSTGEAEILSSITPGENLLVKVEKTRIIKMGSMNIFSADVEIYKGEIVKKSEDGQEVSGVEQKDKIAYIKNVSGVLLPRDEVLKKIV